MLQSENNLCNYLTYLYNEEFLEELFNNENFIREYLAFGFVLQTRRCLVVSIVIQD